MKCGWWKVRFDVTLDGIEIDFDELSDHSKRNIQAMLAQGCVAGEIAEEEDEDGCGKTGASCRNCTEDSNGEEKARTEDF